MPNQAERIDLKTRTDEGALEAYVRSLDSEALLFSPGTDWSYSSIGFDVLGDVIAKVSGQSFEDYMWSTYSDRWACSIRRSS